MNLNLVRDPWLPVVKNDVVERVHVWEIADESVSDIAWPRGDLTLACYELLIAMVYMAMPPASTKEWHAGLAGDPERLRKALDLYADAFNFVGGGHGLFMQDYEPFESDVQPAGALFLDGPGKITVEENKDVIVSRHQFAELDLPTAAMALFARQSYASGGGPGYRTGLRGAGPLVTLVKPRETPKRLWATIWANVPDGPPLDDVCRLPWMRPTIISKGKDAPVINARDSDHLPHEVYFGMPTRLRLVVSGDRVVGIMMKQHGNNYGAHTHPHAVYRKPSASRPPFALGAGRVGPAYKDYLGVVYRSPDELSAKPIARAQCVSTFLQRGKWEEADLIVGGWAMSNATGEEFIYSVEPMFARSEEAQEAAGRMVKSAELVSQALRASLRIGMGVDTKSREVPTLVDNLYHQTRPAFLRTLRRVSGAEVSMEEAMRSWHHLLQKTALKIYDDRLIGGMSTLDVVGKSPASNRPTVKRVVEQRRQLMMQSRSSKIHVLLGLEKSTKTADTASPRKGDFDDQE